MNYICFRLYVVRGFPQGGCEQFNFIRRTIVAQSYLRNIRGYDRYIKSDSTSLEDSETVSLWSGGPDPIQCALQS